MKDSLLVTRPKYDDATEYLSYYASLIIKNAEELGIKVKDFEGKEVTSANIEKFLSKIAPKLIFLNGHGNDSAIEGDKEEIIFSTDKNINLLRDKIIYASSCYLGRVFGKKVVDRNNGCFIGYKYPFSFWIDEKWSAKPSNDKTAALFLEPSNEVINFLLKGKTAKIANDKSKKMIIDNMREILKLEEKKDPSATGILQVLWNNYEGRVLYGNSDIFLE